MYKVNGVALENPAFGWSFLDSSRVFGGAAEDVNSVVVPGRPGYIPVPAALEAAKLRFDFHLPEPHIETLFALFRARPRVISYESDLVPHREAQYVFVSASSPELTDDRGWYEVSVVLEVPGAVWRDVAAATLGPVAIANPVEEVTLLAGISAEVFDADVFLSGVFGQMELRDLASGTWLRTTKPWVGSGTTGLLFLGATGQAFVANVAAPWTPVSEAGGFVDQSGGGGFRIAPAMVGTDPTVRRGELQLTTLSQTSVNLSVRARGAYLIRAGVA